MRGQLGFLAESPTKNTFFKDDELHPEQIFT